MISVIFRVVFVSKMPCLGSWTSIGVEIFYFSQCARVIRPGNVEIFPKTDIWRSIALPSCISALRFSLLATHDVQRPEFNFSCGVRCVNA